jgi:hypothetical protein
MLSHVTSSFSPQISTLTRAHNLYFRSRIIVPALFDSLHHIAVDSDSALPSLEASANESQVIATMSETSTKSTKPRKRKAEDSLVGENPNAKSQLRESHNEKEDSWKAMEMKMSNYDLITVGISHDKEGKSRRSWRAFSISSKLDLIIGTAIGTWSRSKSRQRST